MGVPVVLGVFVQNIMNLLSIVCTVFNRNLEGTGAQQYSFAPGVHKLVNQAMNIHNTDKITVMVLKVQVDSIYSVFISELIEINRYNDCTCILPVCLYFMGKKRKGLLT